jgi:IS5 family transposase
MPLSIAIGPGNEHDSKKLLELLEGLCEKPVQLYADSAYDTESIRRGLESMGIEPNIPGIPGTAGSLDRTTLSYIGG